MSTSLATCTVREVVKEISKFIGLKGWEYSDRFVPVASEDLVKRIEEVLLSMHDNAENAV